MVFSDIVIAFWVVFLIYWAISAAGAKKSVPGGRRRLLGLRLVLLAVIILLLQLPAVRNFWKYRQSLPPQNYAWSAVGVLFCAAGIVFAIWARRNLGRNWGMPMSMREEHELVTSGPYRYVRHPIYTGMLLALFGSTLAGGGVWFIIFVFTFAAFIYSARVEERLMTERFPEQYPAYKKRTKMLIPFVF